MGRTRDRDRQRCPRLRHTLTNNGSSGDSIQKATDSGGYTINSVSGGAPLGGATATLNAGATWTYNVTTSQPLAAGSCIQFAWNNVDTNRNVTFTAAVNVYDSDTSNNNCSKTVTLTGSPAPANMC